jgi:hypothetical protein
MQKNLSDAYIMCEVQMIFILQCAWCERFLGTKGVECELDEPMSISHTICAECRAVVLREIYEASNEQVKYLS